MPSLTWKLIALLTLIFAVAVFLWFIFLGPLSRCARLTHEFAIDTKITPKLPILELMIRDGCLKGTWWDKDD
jgi:HAMP domain-containing protein